MIKGNQLAEHPGYIFQRTQQPGLNSDRGPGNGGAGKFRSCSRCEEQVLLMRQLTEEVTEKDRNVYPVFCASGEGL